MNEIRLRLIESDNGDWSTQFISWNAGKDTYKNIKIVNDDSYTHLALFNDVYMQTNIPKENVVGFVTEPNYFERIKKYQSFVIENIKTFYSYKLDELDPIHFKFGMSYLGPIKPPIDASLPPKTKKMSFLASNKTYFPGHRFRHILIHHILKTNMDIDIYGRGLETLYHDPRIKGTLGYDEKSKAYDDYQFTISIENDFLPYWVSEKYWDPILCGCIPLYLGAEKIDEIFSGHSHYILRKDTAFDQIAWIYNNFDSIKDDKSAIFSQSIIKKTHNMPEFIWQHFNH